MFETGDVVWDDWSNRGVVVEVNGPELLVKWDVNQGESLMLSSDVYPTDPWRI
jgi:hypothetical protein